MSKEKTKVNNINQINKENEHLKEMYDKLMNYEQMLHEKNQKRIKVGIMCIYIIPAFFLLLLFLTGGSSSKIIFLVLWIASLFIIAIYLICVEYIDYNLQEKMNEIQGQDSSQINSLIDIETVEKRVSTVVEKIEAKGGES